MSGSRRARRSRAALLGAALTATTLLALPGGAGATTYATTTGTTKVALKGKAATSLKRHHVKLRGLKPAKASSKRVTLPVSGGSVKSKHATITHRGKLRLKAGKRSATLKNVRVKVGKHAKVTAKLGRKTITLLTLKPTKKHPARFNVKTQTVTLKNARASLPARTAKTLRKKLRLRSLAHGRLGTLTVTATVVKKVTPGKTAPTPVPAPLPVPVPIDMGPVVVVVPPGDGGTPPPPAKPVCPDPLPAREAVDGQVGNAEWGLRPSWVNYLASGGCAVGTDGAEATAADKNHVAFAVTGVTVSGSTTTITTQGTIAFVYPNHFIDTRITNPTFTLDTANGTGTIVADGQTSGDRDAAMAGNPSPETFTDLRLFDIHFDPNGIDTVGGDRTWPDLEIKVADDQPEGKPAEIFAYPAGTDFGTFALTVPVIHLSGLEWSQLMAFEFAPPSRTTWLGYVTAGPPVGTNGTMTPSDGATGDTVTPSSTSGETYTVRYPATNSTYDSGTGSGIVTLNGTVTFHSDAHGFNVTIVNPRVEFDGDDSAELFASGEGAGTPAYDDSSPLFDLDLADATTTDNGDGTTTISGIAPSIATAGTAFPSGDYPVGSGPDRTPNTFGSFALTVPND